ncbi:enoyl-CoA hydratase/isomerase family protein [Bosea sp. CS1GBMeth4]|uniref:enoyl-CoA hydratase/isomerase family protein n=1 Tax=Bosea sp. CS1GBMeth4 TaxID=1892849 RepID=UPI001648C79D|nr:enoyl-CoA hydratase/isomerase family protein [Bosea sp. CS1GBMeth4]
MPVSYSRTGAVATFTIDNGKVNVFTPAMHRELHDALVDFNRDPAIRVGILTGSAGKSFCAGDDIRTVLPELSPQEALEAHLSPHCHEARTGPTRPGWEQDVMRMRRVKPIIGAVDRYCLGQGLIYLLLLTELRIATERAQFGFPEIAYGMGGAGAMTRLGRMIPQAVAMEMLLLGERIDAARALSVHLINRIVPPERLLSEAQAMAETIAAHPPVAVQVELEAYHRAMDMSREQAMDYAGTLFRFQRVAYDGPGAGTGFFRKTDDQQ